MKIYRLLARKLENCYIKLCKNKNASNVIKSEPITNVLGEEQEQIAKAFNSKKLDKDIFVAPTKTENVSKDKNISNIVPEQQSTTTTKAIEKENPHNDIAKSSEETSSTQKIENLKEDVPVIKSRLAELEAEHYSGKEFDYKHYLEELGVSKENLDKPIEVYDNLKPKGAFNTLIYYYERYKAKDGRIIEAGISSVDKLARSYQEVQNYYYRYVKVVNPKQLNEIVEYGNIHFVDADGFANEISMRKALTSCYSKDSRNYREKDGLYRTYEHIYDGCTSRMKNQKWYTSTQDLKKLNPKHRDYEWDKYFMLEDIARRRRDAEDFVEDHGTWGMVYDYRMDMYSKEREINTKS